jgi:hypothetical protein
MTTHRERFVCRGLASAWLIGSAFLAGCFSSPTSPNLATLECQTNQDCPIGYECKAKGQPGGCCKTGAVSCPATIIDAAAIDRAPNDLPVNMDGAGAFLDTPSGIDTHPWDTTGTGGAGGTTSMGGTVALDAPSANGGTGGGGQGGLPSADAAGMEASAGAGTGGITTAPPLDTAPPDAPLPPPDVAPVDTACVATATNCCTVADCTAGGTGTEPACTAHACSYPCAAATPKVCGSICLSTTKCCTNADCAATPATPQCSAGACVGGLLSISPANVPFGSLIVGQTSTASSVVIVNTGSGTSGPLTTLLVGNADFSIKADGCSGTALAANDNCTLSLQFTPTVAGTRSGTLQLSASPGGSISAALSGTGLAPAALSITPPSYTFPRTTTGGQSLDSVGFTIKNPGEATAGSTSPLTVAISGTNASDFVKGTDTCTGSTLPSGATCAVIVTFKPAALSSGSRAGSLVVAASPGGSASANIAGTSQECDTSEQCTTPNRPICMSNVCKGCNSGAGCGGSSTTCAPCSTKDPSKSLCASNTSHQLYDQCVECIAQITCDYAKSYCSQTDYVCLGCTSAPDPNGSCVNGAGYGYNHCIKTGLYAGTCEKVQCTSHSDCEGIPAGEFCNNCACAPSAGAVICP